MLMLVDQGRVEADVQPMQYLEQNIGVNRLTITSIC